MNKNILNPRFIAISAAILVAVVMRILPHWPNFTPVAALALFGGAYISRKALAFVIPLLALFISDLILGIHNYMLAVYFSFFVTVLLGFMLRRRDGVLIIAGASLASSSLFFLITNFAVWLGSPNFTQDINGLLSCYTVALPFFYNGVLGDLFYTAVFFGGLYFARQYYPALQKAR